MMNAKMILGCLTAVGLLTSCGFSPSFDWKNYSENMPSGRKASGGNIKVSGTGAKAPAIYGFSGWGARNRIVEIIDPLVSKVKVSDSRSIDLRAWPNVMGTIKDQYLAGHPIILLGHSAGCSDVFEVSNVLEKANIPVGVILVDSFFLRSGYFRPNVKGLQNTDRIPSNVYWVENYVTGSPWGGRDIRNSDLKDPARTKFRNILIKTRHLNLLQEKYSERYAASVKIILSEYLRRY